MSQRKRFKASKDYPRIDHFLKDCLPDISRTKIEKMMKEDLVSISGKPISRKSREICIGEIVEVEFPEQEIKVYTPSIKLTVLYEDDGLVIIDKPSGISVHPGAGEDVETILHLFSHYYPEVKEIKETDRPGIVHRIDKDTSGLLVLAKNSIIQKKMQKLFKRREIEKSYLALVHGHLRFQNGTIDAPIMRSNRNRTRFVVALNEDPEKTREAITDFTVIHKFPSTSLVKLFPHTGRTHQIRVHLTHYGNPILGDNSYGNKKGLPRLGLHAFSLAFTHPITGEEIHCRSALPETFRTYIQKQMKTGSQ